MDYEERKNSYFKSRHSPLIFWIVAGVHVACVVIPLLIAALLDTFVPQEYVIEVGLAEAPLGDSLDVPPTQTPTPDIKEPQETLLDDLPSPVKNNDSIPDVEPLPEPVAEPEPAPPRDTPEPAPKKTEKKTEPKTTPKTEPKKSTILRPEDIKINRPIKNTGKTTPTKNTGSTSNSDLSRLANDLRKYGTQNPGSQGVLATAEVQAYYAKLKAYIEPKWKQPDAASLNNKKPSVVITLTINSDGSLKAKSISTKSGIPSMDRSVESLLAILNVVPKPPKAITIDITLTVK